MRYAALLMLAAPGAAQILPASSVHADPTGATDASAALNLAIRKLCPLQPPKHQTGLWDAAPRDQVLDLESGRYRLDSPLVVNASTPCAGVLRIQRGTLVAGEALGGHGNSSFLVTVTGYWSGLGVSLEQIVFANNHTGGGLRVDAAHHVHVSDSNFINFATVGIWGSKLLGMGHDLSVDRCRMTECTLGMARCSRAADKQATAILVEFPDSHFRNTVITCARVGIVNRGSSNTFHQLHIWPTCNSSAVGEDVSVGFLEESGHTRVSDCYFDNCRVRLAGYSGTAITNSLFNGVATLEVGPSMTPGVPGPDDGRCQYWRGAVCGLVVRSNRFGCTSESCALLRTDMYTPPAAAQVFVTDNVFDDVGAAVCSRRGGRCANASDCATLFGACE
eukprot:TRINITY_DN1370_c0_g1_i3.p2 TRINITY_DN1370_c0_g1~~TRINITY_DN1370_c0_g1_i3.p2  ORF type:complete len:409 (+),score=120.09 TRINITY_DN1370_c0_g1_i3:56-1228(+)